MPVNLQAIGSFLALLGLSEAAPSVSANEEVADAPARGLDGLDVSEPPNDLLGNSVVVINFAFMAIVLAVVATALLGRLVDNTCYPLWLAERGHPKAWVLGVITSSYALLVPGIYSVLFSYNIYVSLQLDLYGVPMAVAENLTKKPTTESMASLISLLNNTGGHLGVFFVVLYAIILPGLKLVLLVLGECWRHTPEDSPQRLFSRRCILFVQAISKWASPDMFAYILLLHLLRHLGCPPQVQTTAKLDVGFICFSVFCMTSTLSSLAIKAPIVYQPEARHDTVPAQLAQRFGIMKIAGLLAVLFTGLIVCGLLVPCMGLRLNIDALLQPNGPVPQMFKPILDDLHLAEKIKSDVSVVRCLEALAGWSLQGEASCITALVLLLCFVIGCTVANVVVLLIAAIQNVPLQQEWPWSESPSEEARSRGDDWWTQFLDVASSPLRLAWVLKHVAMLDVFCMGVAVVCTAGSAYKSYGIEIELRNGICFLIAAELVHWVLYYFVRAAAGHSGDEQNLMAASKMAHAPMNSPGSSPYDHAYDVAQQHEHG